jgi:hypothetical protein
MMKMNKEKALNIIEIITLLKSIINLSFQIIYKIFKILYIPLFLIFMYL